MLIPSSSRAVPAVWRLCGIPHNRHSFGTALVEAGDSIPWDKVKGDLGWS